MDWAVADCGLKALGMDHGDPSVEGAEVWFCSDEHVTFAPASPVRVGDRIHVIPAHVDPTVAYHEHLHLVDGDDVVETLAGRSAGLVTPGSPLGCVGKVTHASHWRGQEPDSRQTRADFGHPHGGPQADQCAQDAPDEGADREDTPHDEAHGGVHPPQQAVGAEPLTEAHLVHVVEHGAECVEEEAECEEQHADARRGERDQETTEPARIPTIVARGAADPPCHR